MKKLKLEVGQKWLAGANHNEDGLEWLFEIVAALVIHGKKYFLAVKSNVDILRQFAGSIVVFDEYGRQADQNDEYGFSMGFYLLAKSRSKKSFLP